MNISNDIRSVERRCLRFALLLVIGCVGLLPSMGLCAKSSLSLLAIAAPIAESASPQLVGIKTRWTAESRGGVAPYRYRFFVENVAEQEQVLEVETRRSYWDWTPQQAGYYRVRVIIEDDRWLTAESDWSQPFEIVPALQAAIPKSSLSSPVMSQMKIPWETSAQGGRGPYHFSFQWRLADKDISEEIPVVGTEWTWQPAQAGVYQVRTIAQDSLNNRSVSGWSEPWQVNPIFQVLHLSPDRSLAVPDASAGVTWATLVEGGAGRNHYTFSLYKEDLLVQQEETGESDRWTVFGWTSGHYRMKVEVVDRYGAKVEAWSEEFKVGLRKIAVIPVFNLSLEVLPAGTIRHEIEADVQAAGYELLDFDLLYEYMSKNRWRNTAYLSKKNAAGLRQQLNVDAVLLTGVLDYFDSESPRLALTSRLVGTNSDLPILWANGIAKHGESHPGFLGLQRIYELQPLLVKSVHELVSGLAADLSDEHLLAKSTRVVMENSPDPNSAHANDEVRSVALFPFGNHTERDRGGDLLAAQLLVNLVRQPGIKVIEPGLVRDMLLDYRVIAPQGPSQADLSLLQTRLATDFIIVGELTRYYQSSYNPVRSPPEIGFFLRAIDLASQTIAEHYATFGKGDEQVYFYDYKRHWTAYDLTDHMLSKVLAQWLKADTSELLLTTADNLEP